ncbi:MAG: hypothetical protein KDM63_03295 [Verrucomicrobiae bacterium]|nr:hypothetical protein [Verrucomicrobiae bacterium]
MKPHWSLSSLDVIGFASVLETPTLPRILAPVFEDRANPGTVLLPPFSVVEEEIFNAVAVTADEWDDLVQSQKVTRLETPRPAQVSHDLWVNPDGDVGYAPKAEVKRAFAALFEKHIALAEEKFSSKDFTGACENAAVARAVNPTHIDPLVIRAAAELLTGESKRYRFTSHLATKYLSWEDFKLLVLAKIRTKIHHRLTELLQPEIVLGKDGLVDDVLIWKRSLKELSRHSDLSGDSTDRNTSANKSGIFDRLSGAEGEALLNDGAVFRATIDEDDLRAVFACALAVYMKKAEAAVLEGKERAQVGRWEKLEDQLVKMIQEGKTKK